MGTEAREMDNTDDEFWIFIAVFLFVIAICVFSVGYYIGRSDTSLPSQITPPTTESSR